MTKQQEIRKGIRQLIDGCYNEKNPDYPQLNAFQPMKFLNEILPYLHSQDVVIKTDDLPIITKKGWYYIVVPLVEMKKWLNK